MSDTGYIFFFMDPFMEIYSGDHEFIEVQKMNGPDCFGFLRKIVR